jgi:hypothetical protein
MNTTCGVDITISRAELQAFQAYSAVHQVLSAPHTAAMIYVSRMAVAVALDSDAQSVRQIEVASGLSRETVMTYLPQEGESAYGLLSCVEKGSENTYWEMRRGSYANTGKEPNTLTLSGENQGEPVPSTPLLDQEHSLPLGQGVRNVAGVLAAGRERLRDPRVQAALDPSRDVWAPRSSLAEANDYRPAGHRGWALAVLVGAADVALALGDLRDLLGLSERQTRNVVAQLEAAGLATRWREGRETIVELCFDTMLVSMERTPEADRRDRAIHKKRQHEHERRLLASRRTPHGRHAWLLIRYPYEGWDAATREYYCPANELKIAAFFEPGFKKEWAKAA